MAVADQIQKVRNRGIAAAKTARELAVSIAEGADVTDDAIDKACKDAGLSFEQFANMLAMLERRRAAFDKFHERDFAAEEAKRIASYRQAVEDKQSVQKEIEALQAEYRRLGELEQGLVNFRHQLQKEQKEATEAFQAALGSTPQDWRLI